MCSCVCGVCERVLTHSMPLRNAFLIITKTAEKNNRTPHPYKPHFGFHCSGWMALCWTAFFGGLSSSSRWRWLQLYFKQWNNYVLSAICMLFAHGVCRMVAKEAETATKGKWIQRYNLMWCCYFVFLFSLLFFFFNTFKNGYAFRPQSKSGTINKHSITHSTRTKLSKKRMDEETIQ